ncbi:hypothetical protein [Saccharibacillus brassicae]|uniref:Uncharacterized protein n=1 Tax=Saccharibacillus brassicae TaxID=2583377 RepID=A0A4Y6UZ39_SACBS|nr:hypothetical protein [Saccharibacillus brassicae]QDH21686.1 hypothetical protein FFV09_13025 [Saccharibacillus brassicae]
MKVVIDLDKFRKVMVWKDEYPIHPNKKVNELETSLQLSMPMVSEYKKIAVELKLPRNSSYYALLGGEYIPNQTSQLKIKVYVNKDSNVLYNSELVSEEDIYLSIPNEYANVIINTVKDAMIKSNLQLAGTLSFALSAHSRVGSSEAIFSKITKILIGLLVNELCLDSSLNDDFIIKKELDH